MLAECRAAKLPEISISRTHLEAHLNAYDKKLLGMPARMRLNRGSARPYISWKHMLAVTVGASVRLSQASATLLKSIAPALSQSPLVFPSVLLTPCKGQGRCPVQCLITWAFQDTDSITQLYEFLRCKGYRLSPHQLMQECLLLPVRSSITGVLDSERAAVKRRRCSPSQDTDA